MIVICVTYITYFCSVYYIISGYSFAVSSENTKVYSSPSDSGVEIAEYEPFSVLFLEDTGKNFVKVHDSDGVSGWISKDDIEIIE